MNWRYIFSYLCVYYIHLTVRDIIIFHIFCHFNEVVSLYYHLYFYYSLISFALNWKREARTKKRKRWKNKYIYSHVIMCQHSNKISVYFSIMCAFGHMENHFSFYCFSFSLYVSCFVFRLLFLVNRKENA